MVILGEYNEAFIISVENEEPTMDATSHHHHNVKIDDYDESNAINIMTNSYEYYSKFNRCHDNIITKETETSSHYNNGGGGEPIHTIDSKPNSCCIDVREALSISTSTIDNEICEDHIPSSNCDVDMDKDTNYVCTRPSSTTLNIGCNNNNNNNNIISTTSIGTLFYNSDTNQQHLKLNTSFTNTTLTSPVPPETKCCCCGTGNVLFLSTTVIGNTNNSNNNNNNNKEKPSVEHTEEEVGTCCCEHTSGQLSSQTNTASLTRSLTERSLKSCTDELPSYRSLIAFRLKDSPPNYESVTGIRVNVDEVRKDNVPYTRSRLRREVRTCSDLNSSAKRLLVLMAAIIVAICIVMIILTI